MNHRQVSILKYVGMLALFVLALAPASAFAQRRWVVVRPHRNRVVIYQPRQYVIERPRTAYRYRTYSYGYPQSYYSTYYSNGYGYTEPYYASPFYSYRYTQPYFANRYTYSWANPTYRYDYGYSPRHRRTGIIVRWH
jgi:hypothetical protein